MRTSFANGQENIGQFDVDIAKFRGAKSTPESNGKKGRTLTKSKRRAGEAEMARIYSTAQ